MDFLRDIKAKLEEFEQMAREMEEQQTGVAPKVRGFQPKQQPGRSGAARNQQGGSNKGNQGRGGRQQPKGQQQQRGQQQRGQQQRAPQQKGQPNARSVRQPVDAAECPVEEWMETHPTAGRKMPHGSFILNNLQEYVGEAFLMQEILGPPLCMREFDEH